MKIVAISDTHEQHEKVVLPEGDVLIHAGDFTFNGALDSVRAFADWFSAQPFKHKIVIPGNHDLSFDPENRYYSPEAGKFFSSEIHLLNDSGVEIGGYRFWGSPITPWFHDWAFNRMRGNEIQEHWDLIPLNTDVLITHGPPYGILDRPFGKMPSVGCEGLLDTVDRIRPKAHIFGHIHGSAGVYQSVFGTLFVNASVVNEGYKVVNNPIVIEP